MSIFNQFKKDKGNEVAVVPMSNEVETIEVRDIKQYLVNEYDYVHELEDQIKLMKLKVEEAEEIKIKYDASLVTLDEFDKRIKSREKDILQLENKVTSLKEEKKKVIDEKNTLIIKLNNAGRTKEEIEKKLEAGINKYYKKEYSLKFEQFYKMLMNRTGNITKSYVKECYENIINNSKKVVKDK